MARKFLGSLSVNAFVHDDGRLEAETLVMVPPANAEPVAQVLSDIAERIAKQSSRVQVVPAGAPLPSLNGIKH